MLLAFAGNIVGEDLPGQALPNLIRGNERLGLLLERLHRNAPDRNVVVSPISLSMILAALQHGSFDGDVHKEIGATLGLAAGSDVAHASRMLLALFEKPAPPRAPPRRAEGWEHLPGLREAAWISNTVVYRGNNAFSGHFVSTAQKYFGMTFVGTGARKPTASNDGGNWL